MQACILFLVKYLALGEKKMNRKVLIAELKHETNTFCSTMTDKKAFSARYLKYDEEILSFFSGVRTEMGGIIDGCKEEKFDIIPSVAANATPGGKVTRAFFEEAKEKILADLQKHGPVDGVLLSLHGAMVLEDDEDGEGNLLEAIRGVVGNDVPVMASLDLHANVTQKMVSNCDAFFAYETYPHKDLYERAYQAAKTMGRTLSGEIRPVTRFRKLPILAPYLETGKEPMEEIMAFAAESEKNKKIVKVSVLHGFSWADISETGVSVVVTADNDPDYAQSVADDLAAIIWEKRKEFIKHATPLRDAVEQVINAAEYPVLLADIADNPGGGGPADGTHILRELLEKGVKDVGIALIADPKTVEDAVNAGVGAHLTINLGGKTDKLHGDPVHCDAYVKTLCDGIFVNKGPMSKGLVVNVGRTVLIEINGIDVIVTERRHQPWDPEIFRRVGIQPEDKKVLVVKSSMHFRAAYSELVKSIIEVDCPGLTTTNFKHFSYENISRPIFPLDPDIEFDAKFGRG